MIEKPRQLKVVKVQSICFMHIFFAPFLCDIK